MLHNESYMVACGFLRRTTTSDRLVSHSFLSVYKNMVHLGNLTREWTLICWSVMSYTRTKYRKNMMGMTTKPAKLEVAALV